MTRHGPDNDPDKNERVREYRVTGPPGCGKTHFLTRQCQRAAEVYGASQVVVCSLTRAAAAIAAGAVSEVIPRENIGTLHAMAWRAVGQGAKIADVLVDAWNEWVEELHRPWYRFSHEKRDADEDLVDRPAEQTEGDRLMADMNRLRARMVRRGLWPQPVLDFAETWDQFKRDGSLLDFTDLIEIALRDVEAAPGNPCALLVDESQDLSRLAWQLARKWGEKCITFVTVGDPDQLLYHWAGVEVEAFSATRLPQDQQRVLAQSYRVPRAVHELATRWIARTPGRAPVAYRPTDQDGRVRRLDASFRVPDRAVDEAGEALRRGRSVLFATTCSYQLETIISSLRHAGIPFHNPWRTRRGDWNPLRAGRGTSAADRVVAFARGSGRINGVPWWTVHDLKAIVPWLASEALRRGAKAAVDRIPEDEERRPATGDELTAIFQPEALERLLERDPRFLAEAVMPRHRRQILYPVRVAEQWGIQALEERPRVIVSTIHGCKGGEADVVFLFPDLSPRAADEWDDEDGSAGKEGIRRAFYVGLTRARDELVLCDPATPLHVELN